MKKKVLILAGGYSKEREISKQTGKEVYKTLKKKYNVKILDPSNKLISNIRKFKPNVIFNALHGRFGEDGYIQMLLEQENIKYTHSGILSSYLSMNKDLSKKIFKNNKIATPKWLKYNFNEKVDNKFISKLNKKIGFPLVVKPVNEGSSVGVYICNKQNIKKNIRKLKEYDEILIEQYIPGKEIQAAIMGNKKIGAIELIPTRKFYDYKAKYSKKAKTKHIMPANIPNKYYDKVNNLALKAHKLLKCNGISRSDFRFYKNKFFLLELNTQPGMTSLSLVPEIAKHNNISFFNLLDWIVKDAQKKK